eukprot:3782437-Pyramimonas_sp.AAC.1
MAPPRWQSDPPVSKRGVASARCLRYVLDAVQIKAQRNWRLSALAPGLDHRGALIVGWHRHDRMR